MKYNVGTPVERIALDILGLPPETYNKNKYLLVVVDYFTKWPEAYPIPNQEAITVAYFESEVFQEVCQLLGIKKTRTTPLHPQSDGMVERFNRTLENQLAMVKDTGIKLYH